MYLFSFILEKRQEGCFIIFLNSFLLLFLFFLLVEEEKKKKYI